MCKDTAAPPHLHPFAPLKSLIGQLSCPHRPKPRESPADWWKSYSQITTGLLWFTRPLLLCARNRGVSFQAWLVVGMSVCIFAHMCATEGVHSVFTQSYELLVSSSSGVTGFLWTHIATHGNPEIPRRLALAQKLFARLTLIWHSLCMCGHVCTCVCESATVFPK